MFTSKNHEVSTITLEILESLGYSEGCPPHHITDKEVDWPHESPDNQYHLNK